MYSQGVLSELPDEAVADAMLTSPTVATPTASASTSSTQLQAGTSQPPPIPQSTPQQAPLSQPLQQAPDHQTMHTMPPQGIPNQGIPTQGIPAQGIPGQSMPAPGMQMPIPGQQRPPVHPSQMPDPFGVGMPPQSSFTAGPHPTHPQVGVPAGPPGGMRLPLGHQLPQPPQPQQMGTVRPEYPPHAPHTPRYDYPILSHHL